MIHLLQRKFGTCGNILIHTTTLMTSSICDITVDWCEKSNKKKNKLQNKTGFVFVPVSMSVNPGICILIFDTKKQQNTEVSQLDEEVKAPKPPLPR